MVYYEDLRVWGDPHSNDAKSAGRSAKDGPHVLGGFVFLTNL